MNVVVAGGGTAGHVEPALATADALRRADPQVSVTALGTERGLETRLVPARGYPLRLVPAAPLPRSASPDLLRLPARLRTAVRAAAEVLDDVRADVVVGFGGYVALPAYLAARRRRVPVVVHEANARPGLANRVAARFTPYVATASPACRLPHARLVGMPLRRAVAELDRSAARAAARAGWGIEADARVLLVFGGSQGARRINQAVLGAAGELAAVGVVVLHAVGSGNVEDVHTPLPPTHHVLPYVERMQDAYAAADLALCRAGAMTCAELAAVGLPAVYVPLPHGNGEQRLNASPVVDAGGGVLLDDADCTPARVTATVLPLLDDPDRLAAMGAAAAGHGRRDADEELAAMVLAAGRRPAPASPAGGAR